MGSLTDRNVRKVDGLFIPKISFWSRGCGTEGEVRSKNRPAVKGVWPMSSESNETPSSVLCLQSVPVVFICLPKLTFLVEYAQGKWLSVRGGL